MFPGNVESAFNYPANTYHFRQDSHFLYFFGINLPGFAAVIDIENNKEYIFGNDFDIDDIIWMGDQPSVKELASEIAVESTGTLAALTDALKSAIQ